ncbi:MAG: hypothetical protein KAV00_16700 [Phycisphaerae bacterium]|nr:hypothetical protein [Phycisphaerae bacterium]
MATSAPKRMKQIRRQLQIEKIASGIYSVEAGRLTIIAQIVDVKTRQELARKVVTGKADDVLELQRRLSAELMSWFTKTPARQILPTLSVWTRSLPAMKALYEGMDLYDQGRYAEGWLKFRQASRKDPAYIEARYWVGKMYYFMARYEHARRAIEKFVYMDRYHPRVGDAIVEYVHTFENLDLPPQTLLQLYSDLGKRYPDVVIPNYSAWYKRRGATSGDWLEERSAEVLAGMGRYEESVRLSGPAFNMTSVHNSFSLACAIAHNAQTGKTLGLKELMRQPQYFSTRSSFMRFGDRSKEQTSLLNASATPIRILGAKYHNIDKNAMFCRTSQGKTFFLSAPSGSVFKSLCFYPIAKGDDGIMEIKIGRADGKNKFLWVGSETLPVAAGKGLRWDKIPRLGYLRASWSIRVADKRSGRAIMVTGVKIVAKFAKIGSHGAVDAACRNTSSFRVEVDGIPTRHYPGVIGLLSPGHHTLKFCPVEPGTPFDAWTTKVAVQPGKVTKVTGRLPWKKDSPWSSWSAIRIGREGSGNNSFRDRNRHPPAIHVDGEAIRMVWSRGGDLWWSSSSDGVTFSPPAKLALPVSSAWNESSPGILRDESGRFVLTFLSNRSGQHTTAAYISWSRDFIHWSAPSIIIDRSYRNINILQDNRGRFILAGISGRTVQIHASRDGCRWEALAKLRTPGGRGCPSIDAARILQRDDGRYELWAASLCSLAGRKTDIVWRYISNDARDWAGPVVVVSRERKRTCSLDIAPVHVQGRTLFWLLTYYSLSYKSSVSLFSEGAGGAWYESQPVAGLVPGPTSITHHRRWGYLAAWTLRHSHEWLPRFTRPADGPFLMRGDDIEKPFQPMSLVKVSTPKVEPVRLKPARTAIGELTYVACDTRNHGKPMKEKSVCGDMFYRGHFLFTRDAGQFTKPAPGSGTVSPNAVVVSLKLGLSNVKVAIDSTDPKGLHPNVARVDLTGKGNFKEAYVLKVKRAYRIHVDTYDFKKGFRYYFEQNPLNVRVGQRTVPVVARCQYFKGESSRCWLRLELGGYAEGRCRFGDKTYKVRLFDTNENLRVNDPPVPIVENGKVVGVKAIDTVFVDLGNGEYATGFYGQPIFVNGRFYKVEVSETGLKVSAGLVEGKTGMVRIDHPFWRAWFVSKDRVLTLSGGKEPAPIPPGRYTILKYTEFITANRTRPRGYIRILNYKIHFRNEVRAGTRSYSADIAAGKTTDVAAGSPLVGTIRFTQKGNIVYFRIHCTDALGNGITGAQASSGVNAFGPTIEIIDNQGKTIHKIKTTWGISAYHADWRKPEGFKGTFKVSTSGNGIFPVKVRQATLTFE